MSNNKIVSLIIVMVFLAVLAGCISEDASTLVDMPQATGRFPANFRSQLTFDSTVVSRPTTGGNLFLIRTETSLYKYKGTGEEEWQVKYPGYLGMHSPVIVGDLIVAPTDIGQFVVISLDDGSLRWSDANLNDYKLGHHIEDIAFSEKIIIVAKFNSQVTAYNINTGEIYWAHEIPERSSIYLVIDNGYVYVAAGEYLIAYDLVTGKEFWSIDFGTFVGPMIMGKNELVLVLGPPQRTEVAIIELSSGKTLWRKLFKGFWGDAYGSVVVDSKAIYLTGNKVIALSWNNGEILWESQETEKLGKPVILGSHIYVRDYDSTIYVLDINTGNVVGGLRIGKDSLINDFDRGPTEMDSVLIVPFGDNRVFIYEPE